MPTVPLLTVALALALGLTACSAPADPTAPTDLDLSFDQAAREADVPRDLLVATSYALTRLDDRQGAESAQRAIGIMDLHLDGTEPSVQDAARRVRRSDDDVALDPEQSIRGAAALLRSYADDRESLTGEPIDELREWYPVIARYSGASDPLVANGLADQVFDLLQWGLLAQAPSGDMLEIRPHDMPWRDHRQVVSGSALVTQLVPASTANYTNSSRSHVDTVVIHTTEGSYAGAVSWFQNSAAGASAHYVIRSSDGEITQMVDEEDIAWHAGDWTTNENSIGIEHEGYVSDPGTWYTDAMYRSSAALTRDICDRYGIPKDRDHVIGHYQVPGCSSGHGGGASCHTDPGDGWDWDYYMSLVNDGGAGSGSLEILLPDGAVSGRFEIQAVASRYGDHDRCAGTLEGSATNGNLYLSATCVGEDHPDAGELRIVWSGAAMGTNISGQAVVEGYSEPWSGTINPDGTVSATMTGSEDLGGDVGVVSFTATIETF